MGDAGFIRDERLSAPEQLLLNSDALALFVLNVGDGDALLLRFPALPSGELTYAVIDSIDADKTIALIGALGGGRIRLVCATHPHFDHIRGLRSVLQRFSGHVDEFWDSGFRYTSATYRKLLDEVVAQAPGLRFVRPTSGYEMTHGECRVTVLSPSISLRNRYDTYGIDVNNASVVIRVTFPVLPVSEDYPATPDAARPKARRSRTLILGGDAQTDAWGQVLQEFPHLDADEKNWVRQIGGGTGSRPLACDLFKVSHHGSKRGVNLELLERMGDTGGGVTLGPRWLVGSSSTGQDSGYGFPHLVTQELLREVRDPQAQKGGVHKADDELGIHFTSQTIKRSVIAAGAGAAAAPVAAVPAGSIAYVIRPDGSARLYRFGDSPTENLDLGNAREVK